MSAFQEEKLSGFATLKCIFELYINKTPYNLFLFDNQA